MLSETSATKPKRLRREALIPRRDENTGLSERLRLLAREHRACYEIWPVWRTSEGERVQTGFELLLCGVNSHVIKEGGALHAVPYCEHCGRTYCDMREIAEWILRLKAAPGSSEILTFDYSLHIAPPARQHRCEIVVTVAIQIPGDFQSAVKGCESACLKEVRKKLSQLGIQENVWTANASLEC